MTTPTTDKITPAELRQLFQALKQQLNERLDGIEEDLNLLREGLAAAASQPQAAPAPAGQTVDFMATTLLVGIDDNGQPTYKAKGGQYAKFGVRIWPEVLPALGIDPAASPVPAALAQASPVPFRLTCTCSPSWWRKAPVYTPKGRKVIALAK